MADFQIRSIRVEDLDAIARIHRASFDDRALTQLGSGAIRRYYHWLLTGFSEVHPICAESVEGELAGFCFAGVYAGSFSGFLRKNKWYLALNILLRPWLLFNPLIREQAAFAIRTMKRLLKHRDIKAVENHKKQSEKIKMGSNFGILSIAVDPSYQRCRVGAILQKDVERYALEQGYDQIRLTVLPENTPAVKFYEKMGWEKTLRDGKWEGGMIKRLAP